MIEPIDFKSKELMFSFNEYLDALGIERSFDFCRLYKNVKLVLSEINSAYFAIGGIATTIGKAIGVFLYVLNR